MYRQCVVGVFSSRAAARSALEQLEQEGFSQEHVSLITSSVEKQLADEEMLEYGDSSTEEAAKGAALGGLAGLLLGSPLLAIPGIGPLLIAGPIAMGMTGGIVGGFLGAMTGWGVEPGNVETYQQRVQEGAVLVVVEGPPDLVAKAHRLLAGATQEVHLHARSSTDSPEIDDRPSE